MYIGGSVFRNNIALYGGAIRSLRSDLFIDGCLFKNNTAVNVLNGGTTAIGRGGGLDIADSDSHCQIGRDTICMTNTILTENT